MYVTYRLNLERVKRLLERFLRLKEPSNVERREVTELRLLSPLKDVPSELFAHYEVERLGGRALAIFDYLCVVTRVLTSVKSPHEI